MCGIIGFTGPKDTKKLKRLQRLIAHRGYDEQIQWYKDQINFGMNRLAINDLKKSIYPIHYKHYSLILNGEIYNYHQLRNKLNAQKIILKTSCDSEVILPLYDQILDKTFDLLEGMFAIAIYNHKNNTLVIARDKMGEKPLYYSHDKSKFSFSSEIKALIPNLSKINLDLESLAQYFIQSHTSQNQTLVKKIKKLPPAHYLTHNLSTQKLSIKRYWQPKIKNTTAELSELEQKTKLKKLLKKSISQRLMSDVPIGCFLSGGIDSSLITYFTSQKIDKLNTYSISFPDSPKTDEQKYAIQVSKQLNTNHTQILCTPQKISSIINDIGKIIDEPIVDPAVLPTFLLAQESRKKVKVVLTGEGADELFAGYPRYYKEITIPKINYLSRYIPFLKIIIKFTLPNKIDKIVTPLIRHYIPHQIWRYQNLEKLLKQSILPNIKSSQYLNKYQFTNPLLTMQLTDLQGFLPERLLMKNDKMTMFHNLEARAPFLSPEIVEFALNLPTNMKIKNMQGKYILKKLAQDYFPKKFVWRKKQGLDVPLDKWFRNELKPQVINSQKQIKRFYHLFNPNIYNFIVEQHLSNGKNYKYEIWSMIVLLNWLTYHKIKV